jgi:hypothetical protein
MSTDWHEATRFHVLFVTIIAGAVLSPSFDPVIVTEYSAAIAIPLTNVPILIVANDSQDTGAASSFVRFVTAALFRRSADRRRR